MYQLEKEIVKIEKNIEMVDVSTYIAYKMKYHRKKSNLTSEKAAKHLGMSRANLSNIENKRIHLSIKILEKMCKLYKCSSTEILPF